MARDTLFDRNEVTEMRLHRRQFILGSRPVLINRDWKSVELSSELYLSSCSSLPVRITRDLDNVLWCLLGIAVESDPARSEPIEEISRAHTKEITQLYPTWAGRWVLIGNDELHMDAAGLLGCFYYVKEDLPRDARDVWVSSSPALFSHALGREHGKTVETRSLKSNINWYPPPMSGFLGQRLLPSQVLSLPSGSTFARRLVAEVPEYKDYSQHEVYFTAQSCDVAQYVNDVDRALSQLADIRAQLVA